MKSMTKAMVIAVTLVLALALVAAPVAARGVAGDTINDIDPGDTIFVYETGLNLAALNGTEVTNSLRRYVDDDSAKALLNELPVPDEASFDVLNSEVAGNYGVYYAYNATSGVSTDNIVVRMPSLTTDVRLWSGSTMKAASLDGQTVTKNTEIAFKIGAPYVGAY